MSDVVAGIHQPNYLPWIGFFHKIYSSDIFVYLEDAEYSSGSWMNRNRIKTPDGWSWLTVPVVDSDVPIHDVRVSKQEDWREEHMKSLSHNYGGAEYFDEWRDFFEATYDREWERIDPLDRHIVAELVDQLGLKCEFVDASEFDIDGDGSDRLAGICDAVGADTYLCGMGADDYMDESTFEKHGVSVTYQDFEHPRYAQRFDDFVPNLTFFDAVFNLGCDEARSLLTSL